MNANLSYNNTMNSTTRIVTYDENTGGQTTQPTNVNGNWRINGSLTFSTPLSNKKFTVNTHTNTNYGNSVGFTVLNKESDAVKSNTTNLFLSERLKGSYRSDLIDFELSAEVRYRKSEHSIKKENRRETFDYTFGTEANLNLPWDIKISSNINCRLKRGYGGKMILTAPYGTHKYRKASSRRKRQPSDFTYMISSVRMKVRNVPFPRILSPTENPVHLTYILWHILPIGSIPSDKKENDNRYKTKIIKEEEMMYPQLHHFLFVL